MLSPTHTTAFPVRAFILAAAMLWAPLSFADDEFSIVLMPDTQHYSTYRPSWYEAQTQWIRDNAAAENIKFVIHMGDLVNHDDSDTEWTNASNAQAILEGNNPIPHTVMLGNHDFSGDGYTRDTSKYNEYFPRDRYSNQPWFGDTYDATNDNHYSFFNAGGMDFMVLCLEPVPRQEVVTWANSVIQAHPNHRVILATHMYLDPDGERQDTRSYPEFSGRSGEDMYNEIVYNNPNVFLATCGHISYEGLRPSKDAAGNQVYELLSDYQRTDYGGGWLRILKFAPDENRITVHSYSPVYDDYDKFDAFAIEYDMGGAVAPPTPRPLATLTSQWNFESNGADSVGGNNLGLAASIAIGPAHNGNGLYFDGVADDVAYAGTNPTLSISEAFSMATWVKYDSGNDRLARILNLQEDDDNKCNLGFATGDESSSALFVRVLKDGVAYHVVTDVEIDRNAFHHVAFAFDDLAGPTATKKIKVWIDGEEVSLSEGNHRDGVRGTVAGDGYFVLARTDDDLIDLINPYDWPDVFFSGVLDDMRWYDGVLSDAQAIALQYPQAPGDANGDGAVNSADASIVANHWGETNANWTIGDFDNDGTVGLSDAAILAANWNYSLPEANAIPEPGAIVMMFLVGASILLPRLRGRVE